MNNILVFKTSVRRKAEVKKLASVLNKLVGNLGQWNFDLEDCDKILRVETGSVKGISIESALQEEGYHCAELKD